MQTKTFSAWIVLLLTIFTTPLSAHAQTRPRIRPACQVKLLKVAADALEKEYPPKDSAIGIIDEIVYNYNLEGMPRVIFLARSSNYPDQVCIIDVRTTAPEDSEENCPDYKFLEVRTTCKNQ